MTFSTSWLSSHLNTNKNSKQEGKEKWGAETCKEKTDRLGTENWLQNERRGWGMVCSYCHLVARHTWGPPQESVSKWSAERDFFFSYIEKRKLKSSRGRAVMSTSEFRRSQHVV